jgi:thiol-disulfide isomerase/thioredoxin
MNAIQRLAIGAAIGGTLVFFVQRSGPPVDAEVRAATSHELVGTDAPTFSLPRVTDGQTRALADYPGEVVVIDFWATYCGPCREAMPMLERVHLAYDGQGVTMVGINLDAPDPSRMTQVEAWVDRYDVAYDVLLDPGSTGHVYGARRIPYIVVIDPTGVVRAVHRGGGTTEAGLRATIDEALAAANPS